MTPAEINNIVTRLIAYRDGLSDRGDRDLIADACSALDSFAKQTREISEAAGMNETAKRMQMHEAELRDERDAKEE